MPALAYAAVFGLDSVTRSLNGTALTASGFWGNIVGLIGLFAGMVSIPATVAACAASAHRARETPRPSWIVIVAVLGSVGAAVHFVAAFVI